MASSPTPVTTAALSWSDCGSLLPHLLRRAAADALPALSLGGLAYASSLMSAPSAVVAVGLTLAAQRGVHAGVSLALMPAQRAVATALRYLLGHPLALRYAGGTVTDLLPLLRLLERLEMQAALAGPVLLAAGGADTERLRLLTPDGVALDGVLFGGRQLESGTARGVVVACLGNGEHWEFRSDLLALRSRGYALLLFNYRGVGGSGGAMTTRWGAVIDAATALSFCMKTRGVSPTRVIMLGHSIGGAFGLEAAGCFPSGVMVVSDRSFSSMSRAATAFVAPWAVDDSHPEKPAAWIALVVRGALRVAVDYAAAWECDGVAAWKRWAATTTPPWNDAAVAAAAAAAAVSGGGPPVHPCGIVLSSRYDSMVPPSVQLDGALRAEAARVGGGGLPPWCSVELDRVGSDEHNRGLTRGEEGALCTLFDRHIAGLPLPERM